MITGQFELYTPDEKIENVLYLRDKAGRDWYELQKEFSGDTLKIVFADNGNIVSANYDVSKLWPVGLSVAEIAPENVPADFNPLGRWRYEAGDIVPAPVDIEREKSRLIALSAAKIAPLQDAVDLDMATAGELEQLKAWKMFRVEVNRLDSSAEGVTLPIPPEE